MHIVRDDDGEVLEGEIIPAMALPSGAAAESWARALRRLREERDNWQRRALAAEAERDQARAERDELAATLAAIPEG